MKSLQKYTGLYELSDAMALQKMDFGAEDF